MATNQYCFTFNDGVSLDEALLTLDLARFSAEGLVGQARVQLNVAHRFDAGARTLILEGDGEPLEAVARVYTGLLNREIGESAFRVRPVQTRAEILAANPSTAA
mgnify:CR=1 FL=1